MFKKAFMATLFLIVSAAAQQYTESVSDHPFFETIHAIINQLDEVREDFSDEGLACGHCMYVMTYAEFSGGLIVIRFKKEFAQWIELLQQKNVRVIQTFAREVSNSNDIPCPECRAIDIWT